MHDIANAELHGSLLICSSDKATPYKG
jgi:hypothetical protein